MLPGFHEEEVPALDAETLHRIANDVRLYARLILHVPYPETRWRPPQALCPIPRVEGAATYEEGVRMKFKDTIKYLEGIATSIEPKASTIFTKRYQSHFILQCFIVSHKLRRDVYHSDVISGTLLAVLPAALREEAERFKECSPKLGNKGNMLIIIFGEWGEENSFKECPLNVERMQTPKGFLG